MKKHFPTILIFSAYPEDAIIGMGGTMAKLAREGYDIINVMFSCSQQNHWWLRQVYTCDLVMAECLRAGQLLGCRKTVLLSTENPFTPAKLSALRSQVLELIRAHKPAQVYTHLAEAKDSAHEKVAQLVLTVLRELRYAGPCYRFGLWTLDLRQKPLPYVLVDVTATFARKRQAVRLFRSRSLWVLQLWPLAFLRAWKNGMRIRKRYAELFYVTPLR